MFQISQSNLYWFPVHVELTDADGRKKKFDFDAQFERISQDEFDDLFRAREESEGQLRDSEVVDRVFRGWRRVQDNEGNDLAVTPENRSTLLNVFGVKTAIIRAFIKSIGIEGKAKN